MTIPTTTAKLVRMERQPDRPAPAVITDTATSCGRLAQASNGSLVLRDESGALGATIPITKIRVLTEVASCPT